MEAGFEPLEEDDEDELEGEFGGPVSAGGDTTVAGNALLLLWCPVMTCLINISRSVLD